MRPSIVYVHTSCINSYGGEAGERSAVANCALTILLCTARTRRRQRKKRAKVSCNPALYAAEQMGGGGITAGSSGGACIVHRIQHIPTWYILKLILPRVIYFFHFSKRKKSISKYFKAKKRSRAKKY